MKRLLCLIAVFLFTFPFPSWTAPTKEYTLQNGLKLIVKPDHRAPIVVNQICYKVGSSYEPNGLTGISHVLEHMMFKGTKTHPAGEFSRIVARNGGSENAYTSFDYTCYFQKIAAERLPLVIQLEADRMRRLKLNEKEFNKEIQVVMEERRMRIDNQPDALMYERFAAAAHINAPYHHPIIGWMNDLEHLKLSDLKRWYQQWYAPNNAIVTVVGDVKPSTVLRDVKKYYGRYNARDIPTLKPQQPPQPIAARTVHVRLPAKVPLVILGYNVPSLKTVKDTKDAYTLDVLANVLAGGKSARLPTQLIRQQKVATSVDANYDLYRRFDGLFTLDATPSTQISTDQLKTALLTEIATLQKQPVAANELNRVKHQLIAAKIYSQDSLFYQALQYGSLEAMDLSWRTEKKYLENIQKITARDIQHVAQTYLQPNRSTLGVLQPLPTKTK